MKKATWNDFRIAVILVLTVVILLIETYFYEENRILRDIDTDEANYLITKN